ncbi:DASH complex subunit Ask1-domain-containing protein [Cokeromyces recurvatus]|uniref:DASH complex subunit Ask1-domain-containing protein n=1 Tax=Cokeromyces recurvatus TaxID=90255 RepID=UPI00221F28AD|nr:DASH complex subunit Ask1-domain-containing protein [Cokeromyces recurvatus]KAI7903633.1 DASH complex subunit Ask1-domain-containing protein [Cokeromyces recurvatus]
MTLSEEEANAQLERLQQKLTLNLQEIDKNFSECNQVLTSKTIPEIERYAEATSRIWNYCKIWLYFFKSMDQDEQQWMESKDIRNMTNRPPHADSTTSSWNQRINHELSAGEITELVSHGYIRKNLQQPSSTSSQGTLQRFSMDRSMFNDIPEYMQFVKNPNRQIKSAIPHKISTGSSTSSNQDRNNDAIMNIDGISPPHTPYYPDPEKLIHTPVHEASQILAESVIQSTGLRSSEDENEQLNIGFKDKEFDQTNTTQNSNMMAMDNAADRDRFMSFVESRQHSFKKMAEHEELPTLVASTKSPSITVEQRQKMSATYWTKPIIPSFEEEEEDNNNRNHNHNQNQNQKKDSSFISLSTVTSTPLRASNKTDSDFGAFEFSDALSQANGRRSSLQIEEDLTSGSGSNITMVSGISGQIPAKFDLLYFPEKFRMPPASTQLMRVHDFFANRPGEMVTVENILSYVDDDDYTEENVRILIKLLVKRKYLKKVGDKEAWTIRK